MSDLLLNTIGSFGMILIAVGVVINNRNKQNFCFIVGGLFLAVYSVMVGDPIFIALQIFFIAAAVFSLSADRKKQSADKNTAKK